MTFSIAHATARPQGWQDSFGCAWLRASNPMDVEYVLSYDSRFGDFTQAREDLRYGYSKAIELDPSKRKCAVSNWINAIEHTTGDVILVNSDDFFFPHSWDDKLGAMIGVRKPKEDPFVIQVSTGGERDVTLMTIQIASRALIKHWGYLLWHEYDGLYVDDDFSEHAFADPAVEVIDARHLMFEHRHFSFGKSERDSVYDHENRSEAFAIGGQVINRRRASNFK